MKLLKAIDRVIKNPRSGIDIDLYRSAHRFLLSENYSEAAEATQAASELVQALKLTGDDFKLIGYGASSLVFSDGKIVFKLQGNSQFVNDHPIPLEAIPEGLTAKIIREGQCNGVKYQLCERLNTKRKPTMKEALLYLFKARDAGVVYDDPQPPNFGYDKKGVLKVLDHEHFQKLGQPAENFTTSLDKVMECFYDPKLPHVTVVSDNQKTYVLIDYKLPVPAQTHKKILASLDAVGIPSDAIETIGNPPKAIRIAQVDVRYGTPPNTEKLTDFIEDSLNTGSKAVAKNTRTHTHSSR